MISTLAEFSRTLILNLVFPCTTGEPVAPASALFFYGAAPQRPSCLSSQLLTLLLYCTDCLGLVVIVPVKVLGLPANQLTACYLSY